MRLYALSDIHVDYVENMNWIKALSRHDFAEDTLIVAGDVTHDMGRLEDAFNILLSRFRHVFYVPGNHELWVMKGETWDSLEKFYHILAFCDRMGIRTQPGLVGKGLEKVWVVPLFSWYTTPEENADSLYLPKVGKDPGLKVWSDAYFVKWPSFEGNITPAQHFLNMNETHIDSQYEHPVVSFSHFLPRRDVMISLDLVDEVSARYKGWQVGDPPPPSNRAPVDGFNFSRVAGTLSLDTQIRRLGSKAHIHGHQHRNRFRIVDGILYASHCLGYKHERQKDLIHAIDQGPALVWDGSPAWDPQSMVHY